MSYEQWPNTRIRNTLKLYEVIHQGRTKTITVDEAARLCQRVRDELVAYYEQQLQWLHQEIEAGRIPAQTEHIGLAVSAEVTE